jgi:hypothetical protein
MTAETTHRAPLPRTKIEINLPKIFTKAADVLAANGHYKGDFYDMAQVVRGRQPEDCAICAYGALNIAAGSAPDLINGMSCLAAMALADYLAIPASPAAIGIWNDHPDRTPEQVEKAFREIAEELAR